jgi:hypothetical protein
MDGFPSPPSPITKDSRIPTKDSRIPTKDSRILAKHPQPKNQGPQLGFGPFKNSRGKKIAEKRSSEVRLKYL